MTLRVTLEIVPHGNEEKKHTIYQFDIGNQASMTKKGRTRYKAICEPKPFKLGMAPHTIKLSHYREHGAIRLARMALQRAEAIFPI